MKRYIGIDFSINSPGICEYSNNEYKFTSFTNLDENKLVEKTNKKGDKKKIADSLIIFKKLVNEKPININFYTRFSTNSNYQLDQLQKIIDADLLATSIASYVKPYSDELFIGLEGYSYASKGNSFIELISFNSVLRNHILNNYVSTQCTKLNINIFSPSEIKKSAGKGNANKLDMYNYFLNTIDKDLIKSDFFKWIMTNIDILKNTDGSIKKPIDDLIDAYFICNYLKNKI